MKKFHLSILVVLFVCAFLYWITLSPSIKPNDIVLNNYLKLIPSTENQIENQIDKLKLTIFLNKKASKPLVNEDKDYFYTVYIYKPQNYRFATYDYSNEIELNEIHIGGDSRTVREAIKNLIKNENISLLNGKNEIVTDGFMYSGQKLPFYIGYYFFLDNQVSNYSDNFYVIFSFYEKRFGKNLSWSKTYLVEKPKQLNPF